MAAPTVLGSYTIREHIASGGNAQVYRALHAVTGRLVAIKVIPLQSGSDVEAKKVLREIRIHETLKHPAVLELVGGESKLRSPDGVWPEGLYIVLDLASGGDLFDKIAPDFGVDEDIAHLYFRQLIAGLRYLGQHGICHRDIKPENCLLDGDGNLKISDFGLATVFKYKGRSRLLQERCGSPPYAAPELAAVTPYAGEPIDVWSAGILLFALLVGNTPWDEPTQNAPEFAAYIAGALVDMDPWNRIKGSAMALLLRLLTVDPAKRITIPQIEQMDWYRQSNPLLASDGSCADGAHVCSRLMECLRRRGQLGQATLDFEQATQYQPGQTQSQMSSQMGATGGAAASFYGSMKLYSKMSMAPSQRTNPNLSRFFSTWPLESIVATLEAIFTSLAVPLAATLRDAATSEVRIRFRHTDQRHQRLHGAVKISPSVLPSDEDDDGMDESEGAGTPGFDVVCWKKQADPLEMRRLWSQVLKALPPGLVASY